MCRPVLWLLARLSLLLFVQRQTCLTCGKDTPKSCTPADMWDGLLQFQILAVLGRLPDTPQNLLTLYVWVGPPGYCIGSAGVAHASSPHQAVVSCTWLQHADRLVHPQACYSSRLHYKLLRLAGVFMQISPFSRGFLALNPCNGATGNQDSQISAGHRQYS